MTEVKFFGVENSLFGFSIKGHSSVSCDDNEGKIVCSAVSSAAYMAANTIIEVIKDEVKAQIDDAFMTVKVVNPSKEAVVVLKGFKLHIEQLAQQYNDRISILSEV